MASRYTIIPWPDTIDNCRRLPLKIGSFTSIGKNLKLIGHSGIHAWERNNWVVNNFNFPDIGVGRWPKRKRIVIGNDVWVGYDVLIYEGVTIGDGAIIGARSMVKRNVLPYEVVGGCPAKHLKFRFRPDTIEKLLEIKWWNWDLDTIKKRYKDFANIDIFLKKYYQKT